MTQAIVSESQNNILSPEVARAAILDFEKKLMMVPGCQLGDQDDCPLKHTFADGIYVREIFIPAGKVLVGRIHKHSHPNFLLSGEVSVFTEHDGLQKLKGPLSIISKAYTKRVVYAHTDVVWVTVHTNPENTEDIAKLDDHIITKTYDGGIIK